MNKPTPSEENLPIGGISIHAQLLKAIQHESTKFKEYYLWLEKAMPSLFHKEIGHENLMLVTHTLMRFDLLDYFSTINLKKAAIVTCLDSPDADIRILQHYAMYGIKSYCTYISNAPPPFPGVSENLRIALIYFTTAVEDTWNAFTLPASSGLRELYKKRNPNISDSAYDRLLADINAPFFLSLPPERMVLALDMYFRAQTRDYCQYEVLYNPHWAEKDQASMDIILAWRNTPKHNFLYRLARTIYRNGLTMKRVNATYIHPYSKDSTLLMHLELHGSNGKAAWESTDIRTFLREVVTIKYFADFDLFDEILVSRGIVNGNMGIFLRATKNFIHQSLVHIDANLYTLENIQEALCRHPELAAALCQAFMYKFDPEHQDLTQFEGIRDVFHADVDNLDTGNEENDMRRKNVLKQAMHFITYTLKTNFYRTILSALCFRLDPQYLNALPFDRMAKFPELPYAIFFIKGMHFFGYHIRFKDLSRGGLRTVFPENTEKMRIERNNVFAECYNLALTQHKKNKDIPEGGAKGIIFLKPFSMLESETEILKKELQNTSHLSKEIEEKLSTFKKEQKEEYLYQAQRAYIESLITLVNCEADGTLKAKFIVDYWKKPEYLYLGPDENMHDPMIEWIAHISKKYQYKPGSCLISGKPLSGINHKEYGVTSLGLNVYMHATLKYMGINPHIDVFTLKFSGGPDGDVAGNQICNLRRFYPKTAKLIALTDGSGTIHDRLGLDLDILHNLFLEGKPIKFYPPEKLSEGSFLLDKNTKRHPTPLVQHTLCWKKSNGHLVEEWLSGNEMNFLLRHNLHQTKADIFIPAGGRPRTLNESNYKEFLDESGKPTARAIIEGANLYLTPGARRHLEKLGVLIIKDSSANKTGVICSSFEVLCGLALGDAEFMEQKPKLVVEILERLKECAQNEVELLLSTHKATGAFLTDISDQISEKINYYTYQILDYLETVELSTNAQDPLIKSFLNYCLPLLRNKYPDNLMREIPSNHKKAIIACHIAAHIVYHKGISWSPSIVDILPIFLEHCQEGARI